MGLGAYRKKRNFKETTEPESGKTDGKKLVFVVQRHHASSLHYDFRLELDGVLKSWAVPKGPSLNPKDKRLAMMVEDHPYDYKNFEGIIPEGNYGAGLVQIFDHGTYESLAPSRKDDKKELKKGFKAGNLKFRLHGNVLKGEFARVKLKNADDKAWLLIKHRDEFAVDNTFNSEDLVPEAIKRQGIGLKKKAGRGTPKKSGDPPSGNVPSAKNLKKASPASSYRPMLAKLSSKIFDDESWLYERKVDGYRIISGTGTNARLISRRGKDYSGVYREILTDLKKVDKEAVLDGEMVVEDKNGNVLFQELQNYHRSKNNSLRYYAFDLLALDGYDLTEMELIQRKQLLKALIERIGSKNIIYNDHVLGNGSALFKQAEKERWEGIIGKEIHSTYTQNKRSDRWLKFKLQNSQEAVIIGYSKPAGSRKYFGALILAIYEGSDLVYIGNCGTGFNEQSLKMLHDLMTPLVTGKKPVQGKITQERNITWIRPELVCEVTYSEWTAEKRLRHPVYKGLREDKTKENVIMEIPEDPNPSPAKGDDVENDKELVFGKKQLKLTNLNKLYWKKENITKGRLLEYYESMASYILPYLKDRPLSLNRHPNGIDAPGFFQKDLDTDQIPKWIKYAPLHSESTGKDIDYLVCNDLPTLLWMVNLGCIEINPWLSTYKKPEKPVFAVMDLDPNDVDDFGEVVNVALTAKNLLEQMGITPYIKTSGSRGLHIFIHTGGKYDFEISKNFIQYLGRLIMARHPDITSLERSPSKRKNRIYLDFLQNRRGQTIAAPYSVRPKPGATVSTPLEWHEVTANLDIKKFTIFNVPDRIKTKGDLWAGITAETADLKKALESLK